MIQSMTFEQYSELAARTDDKDRSFIEAGVNWIWGMREELAEMQTHFKRYFFSDVPIDQEAFCLEAGDFMWYFAAWCRLNQIPPSVFDGWASYAEFELNWTAAREAVRAASEQINRLDDFLDDLARASEYKSARWPTFRVYEETGIFASVRLLVESQGLTLDQVFQMNIAKLKDRHPNGFTRYGVQYES